jgi:pimeloyl-ACP methyl ester carboxylesterase
MDARGEPRQGTYLGVSAAGFHELAYVEWGDPGNDRVLLCIHGLTRQGRDFDTIARALSDRYRVVCPDIVGRGRSEWLADKSAYNYPQYWSDLAALIARLEVGEVDWLGTSMGGLIGMTMAAMAKAPIRRMVVNDVGPLIAKEGLVRIGNYIGKAPDFARLEDATVYMATVSDEMGKLDPTARRAFASHAFKERADGRWAFRYDPGIALPFQKGPIEDVDLWSTWDRVRCPTLVLRGARSDLLRPETAAEMTRRGPRATLVEIPGCGHPPPLASAFEISTVREFLDP